MKIEKITLSGFRCFGSNGETMTLENGITALVGGNGAGKTAALQALSRLFGITSSERGITKSDFHLAEEQDLQSGATLSLDVVFEFPELEDDNDSGNAVPEFFLQMAAGSPESPLKARIVLRATWIDDGTPDGNIEEEVKWVRSLEANYNWNDDCQKVTPIQRSAVQFVYIPATRNVHNQVNSLLKGRLWQAARWSTGFKESVEETTSQLQESFLNEGPATVIMEKIEARWRQVHDADTDTTPILRLVNRKFEEFIRKADFAFHPDEEGHERPVSELSDGQRSLFHVALTAATLEVETEIFSQPHHESDFDQEKLRRACLTILAIEEPENSLSPFFLSRIIRLARDIGEMDAAQVLVSSHSAAILSRIEAEEVRYFRRQCATRESSIQAISLPKDDLEAKRYVRLAVKAYPEIYFARFVILAEGESERLVIPRIAEAKGVDLDPSFVPIVPLGGRYCAHFWKLLADLEIPYATLLDFDIGRQHGGANMIRTISERLEEIDVYLAETIQGQEGNIDLDELPSLEDTDIWLEPEDNYWVQALQEVGVFLSDPIDLDFAMLLSFPTEYQVTLEGGTGPRSTDDAIANAKKATLKKKGDSSLYDTDVQYDDSFRWYSYLFINGSKPDSHLVALAGIAPDNLAKNAPESLKDIIEHVRDKLELEGDE